MPRPGERRIYWPAEWLRENGYQPRGVEPMRDDPRPPAKVAPAPPCVTIPARELRAGDEVRRGSRWLRVYEAEVLDGDRVRVGLAGPSCTWFVPDQKLEVRRGG